MSGFSTSLSSDVSSFINGLDDDQLEVLDAYQDYTFLGDGEALGALESVG
jgi:hypothetical protein